MAKIRVWARWAPGPEEQEVIASCWPPEAEVCYDRSNDVDALRPMLADLDAVVGFVSREIVEAAPKLKLIHMLGHGIESMLQEGLRELLQQRGIAVARANPMSIAIAEYTLMCMIALARRAFRFHEGLAYHGERNEQLRARRMQKVIGGELHGSTLGLVGFGNIGKEIAMRARAFGMTIGAVARSPERIDRDRYGISFTSTLETINDFLGRCDYVVLCLPGTPATFDLMNRDRFAAMKDGSYLVNVARGTLIEEEALYEALASGKLAGAALDVFRSDSKRPRSGYPFSCPIHHFNVIMTPHYSGSTYETRVRAIETVGENLRRLAHGEPLINLGDLEAGY